MSKILIRFAAVLAVAVSVLAVPVVAHRESVMAQAMKPRPYTLVIGDSLTYYGTEWLHKRRPSYVIDGVRGREVRYLPNRIRYWTREKGRTPSRIVVALGSNELKSDWQPWDYNKVRQMLPHAQILFVTPYRTASWHGDTTRFGIDRHRTMHRYAEAMRRIAKRERGTCVTNWDIRVGRHPYRFLRDGVHQTAYGLRSWSYWIAKRMHDCTVSEPRR